MPGCRLIASAMLRAVDGKGEHETHLGAYNSLFRLAAAMNSHRYQGMRAEVYGRMADVLDECAAEAVGRPGPEAWPVVMQALRETARTKGTSEHLPMLRAMATAMQTRFRDL